MNKVMEKLNKKDSPLPEIMIGALHGRNAHLSPEKALEGLKVDVTGKKILNTPYTIWQLLKHMNYWQQKLLLRLEGKEVSPDHTWKEGWEEIYNAGCQEELDHEIQKLFLLIRKAEDVIETEKTKWSYQDEVYQTEYHVLQAMASHISYHLAEVVILRRMFGAWPPPSGGFTW